MTIYGEDTSFLVKSRPVSDKGFLVWPKSDLKIDPRPSKGFKTCVLTVAMTIRAYWLTLVIS